PDKQLPPNAQSPESAGAARPDRHPWRQLTHTLLTPGDVPVINVIRSGRNCGVDMKSIELMTGVGIVTAIVILGGVVRADMPAARSLKPETQDQIPAPRAFEVVSVKPSNPNPNSPLGMIPMVLPSANGRFSATNVPLRLLVRMAYGVHDFQIDGGPSWQTSQRFDIVAKAEDGFTGGQQ